MTDSPFPALEDMPELMTLREVANLFRVSPQSVKRWDKNGLLKAVRINTRGDRRFPKTVVQSFIDSRNPQ